MFINQYIKEKLWVILITATLGLGTNVIAENSDSINVTLSQTIDNNYCTTLPDLKSTVCHAGTHYQLNYGKYIEDSSSNEVDITNGKTWTPSEQYYCILKASHWVTGLHTHHSCLNVVSGPCTVTGSSGGTYNIYTYNIKFGGKKAGNQSGGRCAL